MLPQHVEWGELHSRAGNHLPSSGRAFGGLMVRVLIRDPELKLKLCTVPSSIDIPQYTDLPRYMPTLALHLFFVFKFNL